MKTALMLVLALATVARADGPVLNSYTYRVKVPAVAGASCAEHANQLGTTFAQATGAVDVAGTCQTTEVLTDGGAKYTQEIIVISYQSVAPEQPYQANLGGQVFQGQAEQGFGLFTGYGDCVASLAKLQPQFESETGLALVAGYCTAGEDGSGFLLTMEAFGQPKRLLYGYTADASVVGDSFASDVTLAATAALKQASVDVAYTDATHIYYYADANPSVSESDLGTFSVAGECTSQQAAAKAIFEQAGLIGVSALCEPFGSAASTESTLYIVGAGMPNVDDDDGYANPVYDSFQECAADLNRLVSNGSASGLKILGAICSPSEDTTPTFRAHLFSLSDD